MSLDLRLADCILTVDNALSTPDATRLEAEYGPSLRWQPATIGHGRLDRTSRNCEVIDLGTAQANASAVELDLWAESVLRAAVQHAYVAYRSEFPRAVIGRDYGYKLLRYGCQGFYDEHVDEGGATGRTLSCSIILNDEFAGGE